MNGAWDTDYDEEQLDYLEGGGSARLLSSEGPINLIKLADSLSRLEAGEITLFEASRAVQPILRAAKQAHAVLLSSVTAEQLENLTTDQRWMFEEASARLERCAEALFAYQACIQEGNLELARRHFPAVVDEMTRMDALYDYTSQAA